ncbi:MAG: glutathione S-transferase family protein [Candidatus Eremiobacteraeota bacterium]|nr:glutathione S-transferase family protein [Candidatus Eremiobacteraeota bacterium]MBV8222178.1 glutathione S-transferase family protein [Candidatus Eremiobacteraeota bacterium]MBV8281037.1 glutathione S-transferase family protein [Candidatus Eremiobacteraeota bacterium]
MKIEAQFPAEQATDGSFVRQKDAFNDWVTADGRSGYQAQAGRYHLYVSLACPWASRIVIVRQLLGLEQAIGMTVVDPIRDDRGWAFRNGPGYSEDPINGFKFLSEAYLATDPSYHQRVTVPVLWDTKTKRIVSNNDDDIMRMLEVEFKAFATRFVDLYPAPHRSEIDEFNEWIFQTFNDGVYRAGFATAQAPYERASRRVFETLDELEQRLSTHRYLISPQPLETDWRFFVSLIRFDPVYYVHFKCNLHLIAQYPNLFGYLKDLYQTDGVAQTVNFDHIKRHYYITHDDINPTGLVPIGPAQDLLAPHGRERLG